MTNDIEMTMLIGYPSTDYIEYEERKSCHNPFKKTKFDDAETLFKTLEEENK